MPSARQDVKGWYAMGARHVALQNVVKREQELDAIAVPSLEWTELLQGPRSQKEIRSSSKKQQHQEGYGKLKSQKENQGFAKVVENREQQLVNMASAAKVAKRVPLIKFPNRKAVETQGAVAVNQASGGGGQSQPIPSLPSGTASSQPPRTKLTKAEMDAILLGGAAP